MSGRPARADGARRQDRGEAAAVDATTNRRNVDFGHGVFRRRLRLIAAAGRVCAGLEDSHHAMRLVLRHDGERVTDIESSMTRMPMSTCPGAAAPLLAFIGMSLAPYPQRPSALVDSRANCTHLHHMALLAIAHAQRTGTRQYDIEVPDEHPGPVWSVVRRDGLEVHRWRTCNNRIVEPDAFAGLPMQKGFARWAAERFDGDDLEAAFVLSNAYLVSHARRFDVGAWAGEQAVAHDSMVGKCYGYQPAVVKRGVYVANASRDTTAADTPLLADFTCEPEQ
ncbi:MAG TPA: DUF2889 domain-containing protein [Steroidobacter sp.]|nr:DUF2889 domain-containing protein [Steroidobacter sp.]